MKRGSGDWHTLIFPHDETNLARYIQFQEQIQVNVKIFILLLYRVGEKNCNIPLLTFIFNLAFL